MPPQPIFQHEINFNPADASTALRNIPAASGVVALFGHTSTDKPYIVRTANLRRRLQRLLEPAENQTKRLNLRDRIARIAWREAASDFEALLILHRAMSLAFGTDEARKRMRLNPPYTVRFAAENRFPRIYVTNHLRRRSLGATFGPFASRFAAERYCEAIEDLFLIRRCYLELHPSPDDPGCIYGEMHKCLAPCQARVSDETYNAECDAVLTFLETRGQSRIAQLETERGEASANMLFEEAAAAHTRITKVKAAAALADDLIQPLSNIHAILLMPCPSAEQEAEPEVAVYSFAGGCFNGPQRVSLLGVRLAREQADVGTSLFAQPMMLAPTPLEEPRPSRLQAQEAYAEPTTDASLRPEHISDSSSRPERSEVERPAFPEAPQDRVPHLREAKVGIEAAQASGNSPVLSLREANVNMHPPTPLQPIASSEERMLAAIASLEDGAGARDTTELGDHLALLRRWYYRPEKQRTGAIFFRERDAWPVRRMLRAAARIAMPPETQAAVDTMEPSFHAQAQSTKRKPKQP